MTFIDVVPNPKINNKNIMNFNSLDLFKSLKKIKN